MNKGKPQIILINPCRFIGQNEEQSLEYGQKYIPLGLLSLGTFLEKNNFRVKIVDAPMDKNFKQSIADNLSDELILIGLSVMTINIASALDITKFIKNINKNIPILWGGIHPTLFPKQTCQHPLINFVIYGDGELPLLELAISLKAKKKFNHIKGLLYKEKNKIVFNKNLYPPLDINQLPIFNYDLLNIEKYVYKNIDIIGARGGDIKRVMPILAGRGCPYHCTFCINDIKERKFYRGKSVERLLKEIDLVINKYKAEYINFEDEIFLLNEKRIEGLLKNIEARGYKFFWRANTRANFYKPYLISEELLARMKKDGCLHLGIGVESGSPRMLQIYQKQITLKEVEYAAKLNYKYGFFTSYSFIIGAPSEKGEEILQTIKFAQKIKKIDPFGTMIFNTFRPQPGCELYRESLKLGFKDPDTLEDWSVLAQRSLRGYCSLNNLPWLTKKQAKFYEYLSIFAELTFQNLKRIKKILRIPAWIARQLFLFRLNNNFWYLLIEMRIYIFFKKLGLFKYIRKIFFNPKQINKNL
jgi:radical SAM superfamily enzyme YgiQ (UPF0313 family)